MREAISLCILLLPLYVWGLRMWLTRYSGPVRGTEIPWSETASLRPAQVPGSSDKALLALIDLQERRRSVVYAP